MGKKLMKFKHHPTPPHPELVFFVFFGGGKQLVFCPQSYKQGGFLGSKKFRLKK